MAGAAIKVEGLEKTLRALKIIDPAAEKAFRKGFRDATQHIVNKTKGRVPNRPLSGWGRWGGRLDWDANKVKRGLGTQISVTKRRAVLRLQSKNAAGAVYENAGSRNNQARTRPDRINQSLAFNRLLNGQSPAPRLLVRTWKEEKGIRTVYTAVGKLIADAEDRVNRAIQ